MNYMMQWNLDDELIIDNFAGGGGASTGIEMALNRPVNIAINHDRHAVTMHKANHPHTLHLCEDVFEVKPKEVCKGRRVGLAWFSPDCTHHSKAKGGKPRSKKIRGLAWVVIDWAREVRPRVIMLENVEEWIDWGPLTEDGQPCKVRKGETFEKWKAELERLEYTVEYRVLRASDYGTPTIRKRVFVIARCDGEPIVWPAQTHGDPDSFATKKPLLKPWLTSASIIDWSIPCYSIFMDPAEARKYGLKRPLVDNTMSRIARGIKKFVIDADRPFIVPADQLGYFHDHANDVAAFMAQHNNTASDSRSMEYPLSTITVTGSQQALVTAHITKFRNGATGAELTDPLATVTSGGKMSRPGGANPLGLVAVHLERQFGKSSGNSVSDPVGAITAGGGGKTVLCTSHMVKLRGTCKDGQPVIEPCPTVTAGGLHIGEVRAFLMKYYGTGGQDQNCNHPLGTVTSKERFGLVTVAGDQYQIVDICMRMLTPRELYRAQGFPESYKIGDRETDGFSFSKSQQVAKCGNSVCPPVAAALVKANMSPSVLFRQSAYAA